MKNKEAKVERLKSDLIKYCNQMGIEKPPVLVFSCDEWNSVCTKGDEFKRKASLKGYSSTVSPLIVVRVNDWNKGNLPLNDLINTLIHELVHQRWKGLWHGPAFEKKIKEIKRGRIFEPKTQNK